MTKLAARRGRVYCRCGWHLSHTLLGSCASICCQGILLGFPYERSGAMLQTSAALAACANSRGAMMANHIHGVLQPSHRL